MDKLYLIFLYLNPTWFLMSYFFTYLSIDSAMKYRLICLLQFVSFLVLSQNEGSRPDWVRINEVPQASRSLLDGGTQHLLSDYQVNFETQEFYSHNAFLLETPDAVSYYSNIEASYDPSYEELVFHKIDLIRGGDRISLLEKHQPDLIRMESSSNRLIYDSTMTMVYRLRDVRPGDIIDYEYTIKGVNPAFRNHCYVSRYLKQYYPMGLSYFRILVPKGQKVYIHSAKDVKAEKKSFNKGSIEHIWELRDTKTAKYEEGKPYGQDPRLWVAVSDLLSWDSLLDQALPLYDLEALPLDEIREEAINLTSSSSDPWRQMLNLTQFVQNDIRYLGFESGVHAFKPHNPVDVLEQRYGDCKDKSILLISLIRSLGYKAYPLWVNTYSTDQFVDDLVSPYLFNHCVVMALHDGDTVFVDPTETLKGGRLKDMVFPYYKKGLLIKEGQNQLIDLPRSNYGETEIEDVFNVAERNGEVSTLRVTTIFSGKDADDMRSYFTTNSPESISEDFTNFYETYFPTISATKLPEINDDFVPNEIRVVEHYEIDSIWTVAESGRQELYFSSKGIIGLVSYTEDLKRTAPLSLSFPEKLKHSIKVNLPEGWPIEEERIVIEDEEYRYIYSIETPRGDDYFQYVQSYEVLKPEVAVRDYARFIKDHEKMYEYTGYEIYWRGSSKDFAGVDSFKATFSQKRSNLLRIIVILLSLVFFIQLHRKFDPTPIDLPDHLWHYSLKGRPVSGWLIIPIINLFIYPLIILNSLFNNSTSVEAVLKGLFSEDGLSNYNAHEIWNFLFGDVLDTCLMVFSIMLIVQVFQKRSSLPRLMVFFFAAIFFGEAVHWILSLVSNSNDLMSISKEIAFNVLFFGTWITYFIMSQRVTETFIRTRRSKIPMEPFPEPKPEGEALKE